VQEQLVLVEDREREFDLYEKILADLQKAAVSHEEDARAKLQELE
jgi:hypothetical protein